MRYRSLVAVALLMCSAVSAMAEAKAYEVVKFKGKAGGVTFVFDYGAGYEEASEMWVTDPKYGKRTRFGFDDSGEYRFVPDKQTGPKREVVLKLSKDEQVGDKIEGTYIVDGKPLHFTLRSVE